MLPSNVTNGLADSCATITAWRPERFVAAEQGGAAAGFLKAEKAFRRLRGHKNIPAIIHDLGLLSCNTKKAYNFFCHPL